MYPPDLHHVYYSCISQLSIPALRCIHPPPSRSQIEIAIIPRYPLLGGWSFTFRLAYSLPLSSVASIAKDGTRVLRVPIGGPFYEAPVRDLTVKVGG